MNRNYGTPADKIVGYTFMTENICPTCTINRMIGAGLASPGARDMRVEDVLDQIAASEGIDRTDEHTFDSGEFPKVIFASQIGCSLCDDIDDSRCEWCGEELV